ncbi:MAG: hypothetical protein Q8M71_13115, partial [Thermodesulfovibrionales bacterium]|nr:hypothetical protein [Thermodesulfovibrionales bacterium]
MDKRALDFFSEKPSSRWDGPYWQPKYDAVFKELSKNYSLDSLNKYISSIEQGDVPRQAKGDRYVNRGILFINVVDVVSTGISWVNCKRII